MVIRRCLFALFVMAALVMAALPAWATHDGGTVTHVLAVAKDGSHVVIATVNINSGAQDLKVYKVGTNAPSLVETIAIDIDPYYIEGTLFTNIPRAVKKKYGLVPPPKPSICSADGLYCLQASIVASKQKKYPEDAMMSADEMLTEATIQFEVYWDGTPKVLFTKKVIYSCVPKDYAPYALTNALQVYWLPGSLVVAGALYSERSCDNGDYDDVFAFVPLDLGNLKMSPTKASKAFNLIGMQFYKKRLYLDALSNFLVAASLDPTNETAIYNSACQHALLGELDAALDQLKKLKKLGTKEALAKVKKTKTDTDFKMYWDDPKLKAVTTLPNQ